MGAAGKEEPVSWMRSKGPWNLPNVLSAIRVLVRSRPLPLFTWRDPRFVLHAWDSFGLIPLPPS